MGYNPWYRQIGKYFYVSNMNFNLSEKSLKLDLQNFKLLQLKESPNID